MSIAARTLVTFQSDLFNKRHARDYFINPDCFGDDVCKFIITKLKAAGVRCTDVPQQEDWGWFFYYFSDGNRYAFNCGLRRDWAPPPGVAPEPWDEAWICFIRRCESGLLPQLGFGDKSVELSAVKQIHKVLIASDGIHAIRWHEEKAFNSGNEEDSAESPS